MGFQDVMKALADPTRRKILNILKSGALPWQVALILIGISMLLTLIAGVIPSRSAAKKDPVVALRSK